MPNQTVAVTPVDNGDEKHENVLKIQWGKFGAVPEAPNGWVNQGYVMLLVSQDPDSKEETHYIMLSEAELDHTIRTLRRARKQTFDARHKTRLSEDK